MLQLLFLMKQNTYYFIFYWLASLFPGPAYPSLQDGGPAGGATSFNQFGTTGVQQAFQIPQMPNATGTFTVDIQNENVTASQL